MALLGLRALRPKKRRAAGGLAPPAASAPAGASGDDARAAAGSSQPADDDAAAAADEEGDGDMAEGMRAPVLRGSALTLRHADGSSREVLLLLRADRQLYVRDALGGTAETVSLHGAAATHVAGEPLCFTLEAPSLRCLLRCRDKSEVRGCVRACMRGCVRMPQARC